MGKRGRLLFFWAIAVLCVNMPVFAERPGDDQSINDKMDSQMSREKVKMEVLPVEISMKEKIAQQAPKPSLPAEAVLIKQVVVTGVTVIPKKEIEGIVSEFRNKQLTGKDMQRCADQITDTYAIKGYITSYAYIDLARLNEGILEIKASEGKVGEVKIEGNRYFSAEVYKERIGFKKGDIFNFKLLKNNVFRTNRHMDRKVTPDVQLSDTPGYADIRITAKDKLPIHLTLDYDNYGSEFILQHRYKNILTFNNLTGNDDVLAIKAQFCEGDAQRLFDGDYFLPLNNTWKWELYIMPFKRENYYYDDNEINDFTKKAWKWYTYLYQTMYSEPNRELIFNYGFVQKFISWYANGQRQKYDKFCALLWGFDYMRADNYGTTVVNEDLEQGIPRMWGAVTAKDEHCSVPGSGGKYLKEKLAISRRQKLIWGTDLLLKGIGQYSTEALTGVNVFSIGGYYGVIDMRGYPRASLPADSGLYGMVGLAIPPYFIPKETKIPLTKNNTFYDNIRVSPYFEYARGWKRSCQSALDKAGGVDPETSGKTDDNKVKSLKSAGWGITFAVPEHNFSSRFDMAWPVSHRMPKDGSHVHLWYRFTKTF